MFIKRIYRLVDICLRLTLIIVVLGFFYSMKTGGSSDWKNFVMIILGILGTGIGVTFFFKPEIRLRFLMVLFFSYITLFAVNSFLGTSFQKTEKIVKGAKKAGIDFDFRSLLEVYDDLKKSETDVVPILLPHNIFRNNPEGLRVSLSAESKNNILPLGGISKSNTLFCNETGRYTFYSSDRYGFNNDDTAYNQRLNTLIIGDSFVQGACVPSGKDIAGSLRKMGRNAIGIAMGGNGPLLELASLKEYGPHLKPKSVVWVIFEVNDYLELLAEKASPLLMKYLAESIYKNVLKGYHEVHNSQN